VSIGRQSVATLSAILFVGGCASPPMGPTVGAFPGPNKPFQLFQQEQAFCEQYASQQTAGQANAANRQVVGSALLGAALGAGLGGAVGGGRGAGIGAASGAIVGTGVGAQGANNAQLSIQQQYDNAYVQCMYAKGNQVPGMMPVAAPAPQRAAPAPKKRLPRPSDAPPPPPGDAPPPPPSGNAPPPPPPAQ
jgi:hypothetical protein